MNAKHLNDHFGLPGALTFDQRGELIRARVTLRSCEAEVYLQGAQLTQWKPAGAAAVLWLSERSEFKPGKAIRGGIPICFPWFGPRGDGGVGPSHGFARTEEWEPTFAALMPDDEGDSLRLSFLLSPNERTRALGFDSFRAACEMTLGRELSVKLTVANMGSLPLHFEEALHSYFHVGDVRQAPVTGLESAAYLDKRDGGRQKQNPAEPLQLTEWTDRVYAANGARTVIHDSANSRQIRIEKGNSQTTVVWNPWEDGAGNLADVEPDTWSQFLCVEAANTATDAITLAPGKTHTLSLHVAVEQT